MNILVNLGTLLTAVALFQLKHFVCDFVLQTKYQVEKKRIYGHPGGILHAGLHALFSIPALLFLALAPMMVAAFVVAEFLVHYHVDWAKAQIDERAGWTSDKQAYWIIFGLDQFIHQVTYVVMIAIVYCGV